MLPVTSQRRCIGADLRQSLNQFSQGLLDHQPWRRIVQAHEDWRGLRLDRIGGLRPFDRQSQALLMLVAAVPDRASVKATAR